MKIFVLINYLAICSYVSLVFLTSLWNYGTFVILWSSFILWLTTSVIIDKKWLRDTVPYALFVFVIFVLDFLLSDISNDFSILKRTLGGKILAYLSFFFFIFYRRHLSMVKIPLGILLISMIASAIPTYLGNILFPSASRALANPENPNVEFYRNLWIGGYEFIYSLVFYTFGLWLMIKYKIVGGVYRLFIFLSLLGFIVVIVTASYFIGIIFTFLFLVLTLTNQNNYKKAFLTFLIPLVIVFVFKNEILSFLINLGNDIGSRMLTVHATELLEGNYDENQGENSRLLLYTNDFLNFLDRPFLGALQGGIGGNREGGHSNLLIYFAQYGMAGLVYLFGLYVAFRNSIRKYNLSQIRRYYKIFCVFTLVFFTIDLVDFSAHILFVILFVVPIIMSLIEKKFKNESFVVNK